MAENINIIPINPYTLEFQEYQYSDTSLITSFNLKITTNGGCETYQTLNL